MMASENGPSKPLLIDDRSRPGLQSNVGASWRCFTDQVMGGISKAMLKADIFDGKPCLRLTGDVSLANNGGFVQMAVDLSETVVLNLAGYAGVRLEVRGNGETYNVHLRTADTQLPWQSYRASFLTSPVWQIIDLPFRQFEPHRISRPLDLRLVRRLALVAIGRAFKADICLASIWIY
jgi:hypothetical protein